MNALGLLIILLHLGKSHTDSIHTMKRGPMPAITNRLEGVWRKWYSDTLRGVTVEGGGTILTLVEEVELVIAFITFVAFNVDISR